MDTDVALVVGMVLIGLAVPSALNGWTEGRIPKFGVVCAVLGVIGIVYALNYRPMGYSFAEVPDAFARVFAQVLR